MKNIVLLIATIILFFIQINICDSQAPYQVAIYLKSEQNNQNPIQLCNGVIVHERVILTTADCMLIKVQGLKSNLTHHPSTILIQAGNPNGPVGSQITRHIKFIDLATGFNATTLENDLAILRLNESLPLGKRVDVQWIIMGDVVTNQSSCAATFTGLSSSSNVYNPIRTFPTPIDNSMVCYNYGNYSISKRNKDICSYYVLGPRVLCNATKKDLRYTIDRGTPLVCSNKVVGVLSSIIAPKTTSMYNISCMQDRLYSAYYTQLSFYYNWIFNMIALENTVPVNNNNKQNNNSVSPPFTGPNFPSPAIITTTVSAPTHLKTKNSANGLNSSFTMIISIIFFVGKVLLY